MRLLESAAVDTDQGRKTTLGKRRYAVLVFSIPTGPYKLLTEALKFIEDATRSLFARAQGFSLTLLLLFLAAPQSTMALLGSGGGLINTATANIIGFFRLSIPRDSDTPAVLTFCLLFLGVQLAFLAHDAILQILQTALPRTYLFFSYRKSPLQEGEQQVHNLVYKSFSALMTRADFEELFAVHKAKIRLSDDIRKIVKETTAKNIPWLRERIVVAMAVLILAGSPGYHSTLFVVIAILSTWSIYKFNKVSQVNSLVEYQTSVLAAVELLKDRLDYAFIPTLKPGDDITYDMSPQFNAMFVAGPLRLFFMQNTVNVHLGFWDWSKAWNKRHLPAVPILPDSPTEKVN